MLWKLQSAFKKCECVRVCTENPLSLCFSISFLRKIRLFKSHYAQLSSALPKPLYSITFSKSEKGGESAYCRRQGLLYLVTILLCGTLNSPLPMSHGVCYLFQPYGM